MVSMATRLWLLDYGYDYDYGYCCRQCMRAPRLLRPAKVWGRNYGE